MDSLKEHIEERLWDFVKRSYSSENYSTAILDSIQFIGDIIREKSGLPSDGANLIGDSFGGANPKIKINNFRTESEKNIQKGIEQILRGIYLAYRNPRSHSKIEDSEKEAFETILFINHLLKIIDKSTGRFTVDLFMRRVFDEDFVPSEIYSNLLVSEIPANKYLEIAIEIFKEKEKNKSNNLRYIWDSIDQKLNDDERQELLDLASNELRYTNSLNVVSKCIGLFKSNWENIDEDARLRAENKLIKIIQFAERNKFGQINDFGKYCSSIMPIFDKCSLKTEIAEAVYSSLESSNKDVQRFALENFYGHLSKLEPHLSFGTYSPIFTNQLKSGNTLIHDYLSKFTASKNEYKNEMTNFTPKYDNDDLPF